MKKNIDPADNNTSDLLRSAENRLQEELENRSNASFSSREAILIFQELLLRYRELEAQKKQLFFLEEAEQKVHEALRRSEYSCAR